MRMVGLPARNEEIQRMFATDGVQGEGAYQLETRPNARRTGQLPDYPPADLHAPRISPPHRHSRNYRGRHKGVRRRHGMAASVHHRRRGRRTAGLAFPTV